jgi:hypothetical protein
VQIQLKSLLSKNDISSNISYLHSTVKFPRQFIWNFCYFYDFLVTMFTLFFRRFSVQKLTRENFWKKIIFRFPKICIFRKYFACLQSLKLFSNVFRKLQAKRFIISKTFLCFWTLSWWNFWILSLFLFMNF